MQPALRFIDAHRNRPDRQRRGGKVHHLIPLLLHPHDGDVVQRSHVGGLAAALRVK